MAKLCSSHITSRTEWRMRSEERFPFNTLRLIRRSIKHSKVNNTNNAMGRCLTIIYPLALLTLLMTGTPCLSNRGGSGTVLSLSQISKPCITSNG